MIQDKDNNSLVMNVLFLSNDRAIYMLVISILLCFHWLLRGWITRGRCAFNIKIIRSNIRQPFHCYFSNYSMVSVNFTDFFIIVQVSLGWDVFEISDILVHNSGGILPSMGYIGFMNYWGLWLIRKKKSNGAISLR